MSKGLDIRGILARTLFGSTISTFFPTRSERLERAPFFFLTVRRKGFQELLLRSRKIFDVPLSKNAVLTQKKKKGTLYISKIIFLLYV